MINQAIYTLDSLKNKKLHELQEIGWQVDAMPKGDRRIPQNWIDAILAKNLALPQASQIKQLTKVIEVQALDTSFKIGDLVKSIHERWGLEKESLTGKVILIHPSGKVRVNFGSGGTYDYSHPKKDLIKASTERA